MENKLEQVVVELSMYALYNEVSVKDAQALNEYVAGGGAKHISKDVRNMSQSQLDDIQEGFKGFTYEIENVKGIDMFKVSLQFAHAFPIQHKTLGYKQYREEFATNVATSLSGICKDIFKDNLVNIKYRYITEPMQNIENAQIITDYHTTRQLHRQQRA